MSTPKVLKAAKGTRTEDKPIPKIQKRSRGRPSKKEQQEKLAKQEAEVEEAHDLHESEPNRKRPEIQDENRTRSNRFLTNTNDFTSNSKLTGSNRLNCGDV